jgi:predicted heme/steroid binding protein/uncharacterized membrane protein
MRRIRKLELEQGTGTDGGAVLVVVDGKVYDVSKSALWEGGHHMNTHAAGADLSKEFKAAPHGIEVLERVKLVGDYAETLTMPVPKEGPPALVLKILRQHPHPVTVHFPIALSVAGAFFTLLGLLFGNSALESAGFFNLALGALAAPVSITAGLLSWRYNYGGIWTSIFRKKAILSAVFLAVAAAAVALRLMAGAGARGLTYWAYCGLVMALPFVALGLGRLGGKITFPS